MHQVRGDHREHAGWRPLPAGQHRRQPAIAQVVGAQVIRRHADPRCLQHRELEPGQVVGGVSGAVNQVEGLAARPHGLPAHHAVAANDLQIHLGWAVQIHNAAEALPNLINPFWRLPLLSLFGLKARNPVGFSFAQFITHTPMVLLLLWLLAPTLAYQPPVLP